VRVADARSLPFGDRSFDVVISINTVHNLDLDGVRQSLREIERVKRHGAFVTVDAYRTSEEQRRMNDWNLTARTILSVDDWKQLFDDVGYTGDYYWFIP
jgi:ubiquinone/menaquinone biosynthesis C-methylase UbiE